jgi:hypothetical protein
MLVCVVSNVLVFCTSCESRRFLMINRRHRALDPPERPAVGGEALLQPLSMGFQVCRTSAGARSGAAVVTGE